MLFKAFQKFAQRHKNNDALFDAIHKGDLSRVKELLDDGMDGTQMSGLGNPPFTEAIIINEPEILDELIARNFDINQPSENGATPLMAAIYADREAICHKLLEHGADPNIADKGKKTALYWAVSRMPSMVKPLLKAGADRSFNDFQAFKQLHAVGFNNDPKLRHEAATLLDPDQPEPLTAAQASKRHTNHLKALWQLKRKQPRG